jgi:two-component sensor histidine kinase
MFKLEEKDQVYIQDVSSEVGKSERIGFLVSGMNALSQCDTISSVIDKGVKTAKLITDADVACILPLGEQGNTFRNPPNLTKKEALQWSAQKKWAQKALDSKQTIVISDFQRSKVVPFQRVSEKPVQQIGCIPLRNEKNKMAGVLQIANFSGKKDFSEEAITLAETLAGHINFVIESVKQANQLEAKIQKDELSMIEIHHRLKNNLSTVTSLIEVDLPEVSDQQAVDVLQKTSSRIKSITQVHSLLYQLGTKKEINLENYFRKLTQRVTETLSQEAEMVSITIEAEALKLDADRAMTCGLILNEVIFNAYKHAFDHRQKGEIRIRLSEDQEGQIKIIVSDNGKGIGNNFTVDKKESMGFWVIKALADRLDGTINIDGSNGTRYVLRFAR